MKWEDLKQICTILSGHEEHFDYMATWPGHRQNNYHKWNAVLCRSRPMWVTVPNLYAPQCSTPDATDTPTAVAVSSTVTSPTQDNTAVIVASVFATMFFILALGLIGYILAARR